MSDHESEPGVPATAASMGAAEMAAPAAVTPVEIAPPVAAPAAVFEPGPAIVPGAPAATPRPTASASRAKALAGLGERLAGLARPRHLPIAAGIAAALALGTILGAGASTLLHRGDHGAASTAMSADLKRLAARLDALAAERESGRVAVDVKLLKDQVGALRETTERGRQDSGQRFAQIGERFDRLHKLEQDSGAKLAALGERLERGDRDQAARFAQLGERIEKRPAASAPVAAAPAAAPKPAEAPIVTGSLPEAKKPAETAKAEGPKVVEGWILREVYDGVAMLEGRNQRLYEIGPGETLPGVGRVEAIERRGRNWVVVTNKGLIVSQAW